MKQSIHLVRNESNRFFNPGAATVQEKYQVRNATHHLARRSHLVALCCSRAGCAIRRFAVWNVSLEKEFVRIRLKPNGLSNGACCAAANSRPERTTDLASGHHITRYAIRREKFVPKAPFNQSLNSIKLLSRNQTVLVFREEVWSHSDHFHPNRSSTTRIEENKWHSVNHLLQTCLFGFIIQRKFPRACASQSGPQRKLSHSIRFLSWQRRSYPAVFAPIEEHDGCTNMMRFQSRLLLGVVLGGLGLELTVEPPHLTSIPLVRSGTRAGNN